MTTVDVALDLILGLLMAVVIIGIFYAMIALTEALITKMLLVMMGICPLTLIMLHIKYTYDLWKMYCK